MKSIIIHLLNLDRKEKLQISDKSIDIYHNKNYFSILNLWLLLPGMIHVVPKNSGRFGWPPATSIGGQSSWLCNYYIQLNWYIDYFLCNIYYLSKFGIWIIMLFNDYNSINLPSFFHISFSYCSAVNCCCGRQLLLWPSTVAVA